MESVFCMKNLNPTSMQFLLFLLCWKWVQTFTKRVKFFPDWDLFMQGQIKLITPFKTFNFHSKEIAFKISEKLTFTSKLVFCMKKNTCLILHTENTNLLLQLKQTLISTYTNILHLTCLTKDVIKMLWIDFIKLIK